VKNVPLRIRRILLAESASNDGLAYPFLSIAIYLTTEASRETAFEKWVVISWLCTSMIRSFLLLALISTLRPSDSGDRFGLRHRYKACSCLSA
jgi:NhaP-type Na+/H+ or K+/H+ antiporter